MRVLVTAGNTREKIDSVRDWGNIFTGNTGYSIACAAAELAEVDLLTSNRGHLAEIEAGLQAPHPIHGSHFISHGELRGALAALMTRQKYDAVFMTAAVADYQPLRTFAVIDRRPGPTDEYEQWMVKDVQAGKVKSTHDLIAVLGRQTEKLVDLFRGEWQHTGLLVKFKLEVGISTEDLLKIGQTSRLASGADYLVANTLAMVSGENAGAFLLSDAGEEWIPRAQLPARMKSLLIPRK